MLDYRKPMAPGEEQLGNSHVIRYVRVKVNYLRKILKNSI